MFEFNGGEPQPTLSDESFLQELYSLKTHYTLFRKFLESLFDGSIITTSETINDKYIKLWIKIEKILNYSNFNQLRETQWKPFEHLLSNNDGALEDNWVYVGRKLCNDFQNKINELYIRNGEKEIDPNPNDQLFITEINIFLEKHVEAKKIEDE